MGVFCGKSIGTVANGTAYFKDEVRRGPANIPCVVVTHLQGRRGRCQKTSIADPIWIPCLMLPIMRQVGCWLTPSFASTLLGLACQIDAIQVANQRYSLSEREIAGGRLHKKAETDMHLDFLHRY